LKFACKFIPWHLH